MPFLVLEELLTELGGGATNSEATRDAAPIFLESVDMFGVFVMVQRGARNVKLAGAA